MKDFTLGKNHMLVSIRIVIGGLPKWPISKRIANVTKALSNKSKYLLKPSSQSPILVVALLSSAQQKSNHSTKKITKIFRQLN